LFLIISAYYAMVQSRGLDRRLSEYRSTSVVASRSWLGWDAQNTTKSRQIFKIL